MVNIDRHSRHILLPQVGAEGQARLAKARILCVGAGGLGSPVIQYLAAAGVGHLTLIDDDNVDISNLQRQVIHRSTDIGHPKADSAKRFVNDLDPNISVASKVVRLNSENANELFKGHDLVIDGTDNIPTRYLIDDTCMELGIPWVYGSVYRFEGQASVFNYKGGPRYRDLFPVAPPDELIPSCADAGVIGVIPGLIGCIQASEAIKIILEIGTPLSGKLLIYDSLESKQRILSFGNSNSEQVEKSDIPANELMFHTIPPSKAIEKMDEGWNPCFIDVRSQNEWDQARISKAVYMCPHDEILSAIDQIPKDQDVLVHCRSGMRSQIAIMQLIQAGYDASKLYNLSGGILDWAETNPEGIIHG
ncbi:MAG: molybdopterin-synthase adenylyltransferase MoeB [Euryarchaeota archaeon]|jgi:adenylyltransferase/sulfurtransferase|nr:molybdopterin-synthase adenylyltransferase MoeB [Euryarchaeota archaeon]MBT4982891.1 molybdopterin-synthase adenylyltransferase MoeB [Euryarchaeota archaeon]MBT5184319.1 molybdopterin-synthase adenylyltransferase MoeB [Euryarchaeota archaeon]